MGTEGGFMCCVEGRDVTVRRDEDAPGLGLVLLSGKDAGKEIT